MTRAYTRELVHGTVRGYVYRKCRCEECRQAVRDYYGHKPMAEHLAEVEPKHGTESRYVNRKCRCRSCKDASNAAKRQRRKTGTVSIHSYGGYSNGCRCEICKEATRVYRRSLRARKKEETP